MKDEATRPYVKTWDENGGEKTGIQVCVSKLDVGRHTLELNVSFSVCVAGQQREK